MHRALLTALLPLAACAPGVTAGDDGDDGDVDAAIGEPDDAAADASGCRDDDDDGFTSCAGDCCDTVAQGCAEPELVNPGAFEAPGNLLDDDCDGDVDNPIAAMCDIGLVSNSAEPLDYARAIDLCQTATETDAQWGVIETRWRMPDGVGEPIFIQHAIRPDFGDTLVQHGNAMAVLSTGMPSALGHTQPGYSNFLSIPHGSSSGFPADWLAAHAGTLPNYPGCPAPMGTLAYDPVMLELRIRAPTNARSFSLRMNFLSAEYPEWVCSPYNDFLVVLLDSMWAGTPPNPADENLAVYQDAEMTLHPIGVNLAYGGTGLFSVCENGATGCGDLMTVPGTNTSCTSAAELHDTLMDLLALGCGENDLQGGGTGWLTTRGNISPGEVFTLRIALWDTSDAYLDSVALIDAFEWSIDPSEPGTIVVD